MFFGQAVRAVTGNGIVTSKYYSSWFPRMGTRAVFACNLITAYELDSLKIQVQTKKREDDNEDAVVHPVGGEASISTGVTTFLRGNPIDASDDGVQGFFDLVRYVYTVKSNNTKRGWCHFRMLDPTWEND